MFQWNLLFRPIRWLVSELISPAGVGLLWEKNTVGRLISHGWNQTNRVIEKKMSFRNKVGVSAKVVHSGIGRSWLHDVEREWDYERPENHRWTLTKRRKAIWTLTKRRNVWSLNADQAEKSISPMASQRRPKTHPTILQDENTADGKSKMQFVYKINSFQKKKKSFYASRRRRGGSLVCWSSDGWQDDTKLIHFVTPIPYLHACTGKLPLQYSANPSTMKQEQKKN